MEAALTIRCWSGRPGLGKSQLASVIAQEMAADFHEVLGQSITSIGDLNALLLAAKDKDIVHIDECHELDKTFQTALYLGSRQTRIFVNSRRSPQAIPIADFTLLLSTTDEYCLARSPPRPDEADASIRVLHRRGTDAVLRHRCKALDWEIDEDVLPLIAQRSRGIPRFALKLLQSCRRVCSEPGRTLDHRRPLGAGLPVGAN